MKIDILTLFPDMFVPLKESIIKRATEDGLVQINVTNIRDFALPPHFKCDDEPFGGGAGMVMMCDPIFKAIESLLQPDSKVFYLSPRGCVFDQKMAQQMTAFSHIILLCGHYEGIDQRVLDYFHITELSIGDFVLTGGEIPAMAVVDAVVRLLPDVLSQDSTVEESFNNGLLEYDQYTRPADYRGMKVPEVLLSGNHKKIKEYHLANAYAVTAKNRPDLLRNTAQEDK